MNRYQLVNIYTSKETCQHCGRGIKTVCVVKDNIEGKKLHVGSKCIENIMNLNENFAKAVIKEVEKYAKLFKKVNEFNAEKIVTENRIQLEKFHSGIITKENKNYGGVVWDEEKHNHRAKTLQEFDSEYEENIKHVIYMHNEYDIKDLEKQREKLNKLSKKGLINIEA